MLRLLSPQLFALAFVAAAIAQPPNPPSNVGMLSDLPWGDRPPSVRGDEVEVAALGQPDHRVHAWDARRRSARRRGEERARAALHRWADDALAGVGAPPQVAEEVHAVVESAAVAGVRPLADGSAVVVLRLRRAELRRVAPLEGLPW